MAESPNIAGILFDSAERWPDKPAVLGLESACTFSQLAEQASGLEKKLDAAGVRAGMRVGLHARNGADFIAAAFAVMLRGAVLAPISHQLKRAEVSSLLSDLGLHALLTDGSGPLPEGLEPRAELSPFTLIGLAPFDGADARAYRFIRYSSGTTGEAKGVLLGDEALVARTAAAQAALELHEDDIVLWVLPMAYHFLVTILSYVRYGIPIALSRDLLAASLIDAAHQHGATVLYAAPMHYQVLAADRSGRDLASLRWAISTSSGITAAIQDRFFERYQLPLTQVYGIIEAGLPLVSRPDDPRESWGSVGRPAPGFEIGLLDEQGTLGDFGRLALRGPGLFDAYLSPWRPQAECLEAGWFLTGDLARRDEGGFVTIEGREKSMINVSGNKAFPEEIEAVLATHARVRACRVFGSAHPLTGEIVEAEVCLNDGGALDAEALMAYCRERLSSYKVPQRIRAVEAIAETGSGKVKR